MKGDSRVSYKKYIFFGWLILLSLIRRINTEIGLTDLGQGTAKTFCYNSCLPLARDLYFTES